MCLCAVHESRLRILRLLTSLPFGTGQDFLMSPYISNLVCSMLMRLFTRAVMLEKLWTLVDSVRHSDVMVIHFAVLGALILFTCSYWNAVMGAVMQSNRRRTLCIPDL